MINSFDEKRLQRALSRARCVLFLGAGFSSGASDRNGRALPTGSQLASELWDWCGLGSAYGSYAGQELQRVYQIALNKRGEKALTDFIRERLTAAKVPAWFDFASQVYWYRIYTTNVDNLIEVVYKRTSGLHLDVVDGLHERPRDRDQFLERLQYIKLNGDLKDGAKAITFGSRAHARRAVEVDPWWDQFVRDYAQNVTVFIGTSLNEPLLNQAIEARGPRGHAAVEGRPGSFLVSKPLDPTVAISLPEFNVQGIEGSTQEFLEYLNKLIPNRVDRLDVLRESAPGLSAYVAAAKKGQAISDAAASFLAVFDQVQLPDVPRNYSSLYHQGAEPVWLDIAGSLDAPREVGGNLLTRVDDLLHVKGELPVLVISGNRGTGKSTVLMRTAARLAGEGVPAYYSRGDRIDSIEAAIPFIQQLPSRVVLFIDNADTTGRRGIELIETTRRLKNPPVIVLGVRSSALYYLDDVRYEEIAIGDLTDRDIEGLIDTLSTHRSLGVLTEASRNRIKQEFSIRADKVLLVALKEATLSLGFREIIHREFRDIGIEEHKLLYLCAALAGAEDGSLASGQLLDCSLLTPAETQASLARELRGVVIQTAESGERWSARHPLIAIEVVSAIAPRPLLAVAYKRLLSTLASDMDSRARSGEPARAFRLYKRLVSHRVIYERFDRDIDEARGIFEALEERLAADPHFWLQFGSLELEYGELAWAERHLSTALGLNPNDFFIRNAWAHLKFAQGVAALDYESAVALRKEASALLDELIGERGEDSNYPWHIKLTQFLRWLEIWESDRDKLKAELSQLRELADEACEARPRSHELRELNREITRQYLQLAVDEEG